MADESSSSLGPSRLAWPDYAKGIAILLVVLCHTAEGFFTAIDQPRPPFWHDFIEISYAFMVPVFFVVAGWFSERSFRTRKTGAQVRQVISGILYPYVLWTILQTALMIVTKAGNRVVHWSDLPAFLLLGAMQFWFLRALVLAYGLDLVLRHWGVSSAVRLGVSLVLLVVFSFPGLAAYPGVALLATHYFYFVAGAFCLDCGVAISGRRSIQVAAVGSLALLLLLHFAGARCTTIWRPLTALAGIVACISVSALLPNNQWLLVLRLIGRYSLAIYCLHVIVAAGLRIVLLRMSVQNPDLQIALGFGAAVLVPLALAHYGSKYLGWLFRLPSRVLSEGR